MKRASGIGLLVLLAGCAAHLAHVGTGSYIITDGRDTNLQVTVQQAKIQRGRPPQPSALADSANLPVASPLVDIKYGIAIKNQTQDPVTVRHITLSCRGRYASIPRTTRNYEKTIAPGATGNVEFWVEAREPGNEVFEIPTVVATVDFVGTQGKHLESFLCNVNGGAGTRTTTR